MSEIIKVKIADYKISDHPDILISNGLGSCVGLVLYDSEMRTAGLAHIMLPAASSNASRHLKGKYADTAIRMMLAEMEEKGCLRDNISAKLAGGASMFTNLATGGMKGIGERNVEAVTGQLDDLDIPLLGHDTGGDYGRSVEFHTETGIMRISSVRHDLKVI